MQKTDKWYDIFQINLLNDINKSICFLLNTFTWSIFNKFLYWNYDNSSSTIEFNYSPTLSQKFIHEDIPFYMKFKYIQWITTGKLLEAYTYKINWKYWHSYTPRLDFIFSLNVELKSRTIDCSWHLTPPDNRPLAISIYYWLRSILY